MYKGLSLELTLEYSHATERNKKTLMCYKFMEMEKLIMVDSNVSFFREAYPEYELQSIQLAYDINKISALDQERLVFFP